MSIEGILPGDRNPPAGEVIFVLKHITKEVCEAFGIKMDDPRNFHIQVFDLHARLIDEHHKLKCWQHNICQLLGSPLEAGDNVHPNDAYSVLSVLLDTGLPHHNDPGPQIRRLLANANLIDVPGIRHVMKELRIPEKEPEDHDH